MLGAVELLRVDIAVLAGLWLGVSHIVARITRMFALRSPTTTSMSSGLVEGQQ